MARLRGIVIDALGASLRDEHDDFTVLLDPEGNEFCVLLRGESPAPSG